MQYRISKRTLLADPLPSTSAVGSSLPCRSSAVVAGLGGEPDIHSEGDPRRPGAAGAVRRAFLGRDRRPPRVDDTARG